MNLLPSNFLHHNLPYFILHNKLPAYDELKVFVVSSSVGRTKLDSRRRKCVYIGTKYGTKGHILFDLYNRNIFISRDTIFHEHIFPYPISSKLSPLNQPISHHPHIYDYPLDDSSTPIPPLPSNFTTELYPYL